MALLLCALLAFLGPAVQDEDVAREWRVRRWAVAPAEATAALDAALASSAWEERAAALEALARRAEAGGELAPRRAADVARLLDDEHPGVRAAALHVLAHAGAGVPLDASALRREATSALPLERLQLARALAVADAPARGELLATLALDPDARVARAARAALAAPGASPDDVARLGDVVLALDVRGADAELFDVFLLLARTTPPPALLARLRAHFAGDGRRTRGHRAVVEALALAHGAGGDPARLVDGWLGAGGWNPRRQALLTAAAAGGDEELARLLFTVLDELAAAAAGQEPTTPSAAPGLLADARAIAAREGAGAISHLPFALAEAAAAGLAPASVAALLPARAPATVVLVLDELGRRADAWDPAAMTAWLAPDAERDVRIAAVEACAATFARRGDPGAGALLVRALDDADPGVEARAWRALSDADDPAPWGEALHAAWRRLPAVQRLARTAWMTRAHPFVAFRTDLLAMGESPDERRAAAAELLAPFPGDDEIRAALVRWARDEIARRDAGTGPEEAERAERRLQAVVHALGRVDPAGGTETLEAALVASRGWSTEVGKTAAAALGFTREGRRRLAEHLGEDEDRRTRIEAAIVLAQHPTEAAPAAAVAVLMRDFAFAAPDLRVRMLPALARARTAEGHAFLRDVVRTGGEADRVTALHELAAHGGPDELRFLEELVRRAPDHETRRLAARLLPTAAGERRDEAAALLTRLVAELGAGLLDAERTAPERALLRSDLLSALGATGAFPPELEGEWLRRPLGAAAGELRRRFAGEDLADEHFRWQAEIALAGHFATHGRFAAALAENEGWWRADGRLLLALAAEARAADAESPVVDRLLRAGLVALVGEHERNERRIGHAKGQLFARAWAAERWDEAARLVDGILRDRRAGIFPERTWTRLFGTADPRRGVDPLARLESAGAQARARAALDRGDTAAARAWATTARRLHGASRAAAREQARLEEALAARDER